MNKLLIAITLLIMGCSSQFDIGQTEQESHTWNNYHWPTDSLVLDVDNNMKDQEWQQYFDETLSEWDSLDTPLSLVDTESGGQIVTEARRSRQWLGLATVYLNADGHITAGKVTMNPTMLTDSRYTPEAVQHVFCQELGHVLGLNHIKGNTCMDDCTWAETTEEWLTCLNNPASVGTNQHDEDQLNLIYSHLDVSEPSPDAGTTSGCGKSKRPGCRQAGWVTVHSFPMFKSNTAHH